MVSNSFWESDTEYINIDTSLPRCPLWVQPWQEEEEEGDDYSKGIL